MFLIQPILHNSNFYHYLNQIKYDEINYDDPIPFYVYCVNLINQNYLFLLITYKYFYY